MPEKKRPLSSFFPLKGYPQAVPVKEGIDGQFEIMQELRKNLGSWSAASARLDEVRNWAKKQAYAHLPLRRQFALWNEAHLGFEDDPYDWWMDSDIYGPRAMPRKWGTEIQPSFSWLKKGQLALGSMYATPAELKKQGITKVYNIREYHDKVKELKEEGIKYDHFSVRDFQAPSQKQMDLFVAGLDADLANGEKVFVHCHAGMGRSATMVAAWMIKNCHTPDSAITELSKKRVLEYNPERKKALDLYASRVSGTKKCPIPVSLDD